MTAYSSYRPKIRAACIGICGVFAMFFLQSCVVFDPIGNAVSRGYENMTTYFNSYYNARRLFREAEDDIRVAQLANRGKNIPVNQINQIPATTKQKLTVVIDKCSNILAFHANSGMVDDALLMIGKSYFYEEEYLKAERKFSELIAQFASSDLVPEAQLWYAKTESRLRKFDKAQEVLRTLVPTLIDHGEESLAFDALMLSGSIHRSALEYDFAAAKYGRATDIAPNDDLQASSQTQLADMYVEQGKLELAIKAYARVSDLADDIYTTFHAKLESAICMRALHNYAGALDMLGGLKKDFRYKEYLPQIVYERGRTLDAAGRRDEAIDELRIADTTYAKTDNGYAAAFELGRIYQEEVGNYALGLDYYTRAAGSSGLPFSPVARRRSTQLAKYFDAAQRLHKADSLLSLKPDTLSASADTLPKKVDSVNVVRRDSIHIVPDSSKIVGGSDASKLKDTAKAVAARPTVRQNVDSLLVVKSIAATELGEIFYSEFQNPDSAIFWYNQALTFHYDKERSPRILFVLAEIARSDSARRYTPTEELYRRLIRDFPESEYAREGRRLLGIVGAGEQVDVTDHEFREAEKLVDAKQYQQAAQKYADIAAKNDDAALSVQSEYALAWVLENHLAKPDSALAEYRHIALRHATSPFGQLAQRRIPPAEPRPDTSKAAAPAVSDSSKKMQGLPKIVGDGRMPVHDTTKTPAPTALDSVKKILRLPKSFDDDRQVVHDSSKSVAPSKPDSLGNGLHVPKFNDDERMPRRDTSKVKRPPKSKDEVD